jgi:hypothetical protein
MPEKESSIFSFFGFRIRTHPNSQFCIQISECGDNPRLFNPCDYPWEPLLLLLLLLLLLVVLLVVLLLVVLGLVVLLVVLVLVLLGLVVVGSVVVFLGGGAGLWGWLWHSCGGLGSEGLGGGGRLIAGSGTAVRGGGWVFWSLTGGTTG